MPAGWVCAGGLADLFEPLVREDLHASIEEPGLFLYFPRYASETSKLRAFIKIAGAVGRRKIGGQAQSVKRLSSHSLVTQRMAA
jgi:hypothetical protein